MVFTDPFERTDYLFGFNDIDIQGAIFDLDGVLVDTAGYHYLAWKRLTCELGFDFEEADNERLKGVSRQRSLEILLEIGNKTMTPDEMQKAQDKKNAWYVEYLSSLDETSIMHGAHSYILRLRENGIRIALGSASKNAQLILQKLDIAKLFDAVIDGNSVSKAKPDPEVFLKGAKAINVAPANCVVFEDALSGIQAAKAGGMRVIALGTPDILPGADKYVRSLVGMFA